MSYEHYFVVKYSAQDGFEIDPEVESDLFQNGTVWNTETKDWEVPYEGDNKWLDNDDEIAQLLLAIFRTAKVIKEEVSR